MTTRSRWKFRMCTTTNDLTLYSFSSLYIFVTLGWPPVAETCRQPNKTDTKTVVFWRTYPLLICIKHNGDDASKVYTHRIMLWNPFCSSTAQTFMRTRLNVTFIVTLPVLCLLMISCDSQCDVTSVQTCVKDMLFPMFHLAYSDSVALPDFYPNEWAKGSRRVQLTTDSLSSTYRG